MRVYRLSAVITTLVVAALVSWAGPSWAESPQRIGIAVGTAVNVDSDEADVIADALAQALEERLGVVVTAGAEARRRLPLDGVPEGCASDSDCRADLAERLDADELLLLVIVRVGEQVQIDVTWTDLAAGKVSSRPAIMIDEGDDRQKLFAAEARSLLPHIQPVEARAPAQQPINPPPSATPVTPSPAVRDFAQPRDSGRTLSTPVWATLGVGAAAAAVGTTFGILTASKYSDCNSADDPCDQQTRDQIGSFGLIADISFGVSIAAGATAAILYLTSAGDGGQVAGASSLRAPAVTVSAGADRVWLGVGGRF